MHACVCLVRFSDSDLTLIEKDVIHTAYQQKKGLGAGLNSFPHHANQTSWAILAAPASQSKHTIALGNIML